MEDYKTHVLSCLTIDKDGTVPFMDIVSLVREHQLFNSKKTSSLDGVVKSIHSHLGSSKSRKLGLALLKEMVDQCSTELFLGHVNTWIHLLIQTLQSHDSDACHRAACHILADVLETASSFPELSRDIANTTVPQIFPLLLEANVNWMEAAVSCIGMCIKNFPGPCGAFKSKLESLIWQELSENTTMQSVVTSYALLPRCGGGGSHGVKFVEAWSAQCSRVLRGLNQALDLLYEGVESGTEYRPAAELPELSCPDSEPERGKYLTGRFQTLALCLEALLSEPFPTVVKVPVDDILQTVCRCLAINRNMMLSRPSTSKIWLLTRLPSLQQHALSLLSGLVCSIRHGLLPHSDIINKLFVQTLISTHWDSLTSGQECPLRSLRLSAYSGLLLWLQVASYGTNLIAEGNDLIKEILHDIVPVTDSLKLEAKTINIYDGPPVKKKKKGGGYQELGGGIGSQKKTNRLANADLTVIALDVLTALNDCFGSSWKPKIYKDILQKVISTTISVQQSSDPPVPYQSGACRLALYRALLSCTVTVHLEVPAPVQISLGLFRRSLQDHCLEVSTFSRTAMLFCECIIHPRAPCVRGPVLTQCDIVVQTPQNSSRQLDPALDDQSEGCLISSRSRAVAVDTQMQTSGAGSGTNTNVHDGRNGQDEEALSFTGNSKVIYLKKLGVGTQTEDFGDDDVDAGDKDDDDDDGDDGDDDDANDMSVIELCDESEMMGQGDVAMETGNTEAVMFGTKEKEMQNGSSLETEQLGTSSAGSEQKQKNEETDSAVTTTTTGQEGTELDAASSQDQSLPLADVSAQQSFASAHESFASADQSFASAHSDENTLPVTSVSSADQPSAEVEAMLSSFVDADPDSD